MENQFKYNKSLYLELGGSLKNLEISYHTYGKYNHKKNNVIWVCHALTANSDAADWWNGIIGKNKLYDPDEYFIVCANFIGSCYGSTGPLSYNSKTNKPYYRSFPNITIRDMVNAHNILRLHLGIKHIHTIIGSSMGAFQAIEWNIINPNIFTHLIFIASNSKASPWAIALNESQRMAILSDSTFYSDNEEGGTKGLMTARSIALLSYRNSLSYNLTQAENDSNITDGFKASSYQQYQGLKLAKRFNAYSYYVLTKAIDSHNIERNRGQLNDVLKLIKAKTLCIGISTDLLFPTYEQKLIADGINNAVYKEIDSDYGHDGFLIENEVLTRVINEFYQS
ncbi:MAG: homoserine O-acetyltransferase [Bacteroidales bacterium]|jgi:homoserine O-acetyltransferase